MAGPNDVTVRPGPGVATRPPGELARDGRVIAGKYRLVRLLGSGGMGAVHEAVNTWTGRRVAIKQLLVAISADGTIAQRFALEARTASRIAHPNVVEILDLGEDPETGALFMVQELLTGETLRGRLAARGALPVDEVLRVLAPAVDALAVAHDAGVIHRDLKPENIFLSREAGGEVTKLIDFGLSKRVGGDAAEPADAAGDREDRDLALTEHGRQLGTPYYMSPEQLRGEPDVDGRSDVWSIGVVLFEAVAGGRPFVGPSYSELVVQILKQPVPELAARQPAVPAAFAALIARALVRDRANRISIHALRDGLAELVRRPDAQTVPSGNPYRGLLPFDATHRGVFFGRAGEISAVLERVRRVPFTLVAGDSGVGKSSVIRAGVLPALGDGARVITLVPGRQPLAALGQALAAVTGEAADDVTARLADDPAAVGATLAGTALIVFVDQLEELLTLADAGDAAATTTALWLLLDAVPGMRLIATLRSDFLGRLAALPGIGDEVTGALYLLRPLTAAGVREAIVGPTRITGLAFESPALIAELVAATSAEISLPLLQFALAELWDARDVASGTIRAASLVAIGGVTGALARHADGVLAGLGPRYRLLARHVLTSLVTVDGTRARRTLAELRDAAARLHEADARELGSEAIGAVLEALVAGRLITVEDTAGTSTYQIAHDALVDGWDTLRGWRGHDIERGVVRQRLARAAAEWERLGRPAQLLWQAPQLAEVADAGSSPFLAASRSAARRRRLTRRALALGIPLLVGVGFAGARVAGHRRTAAEIAEHVAAADTAMAHAAVDSVELEHRRLAAFALFDARRTEPGEDAWTAVLQHQRALDDGYRAAAEHLEAALALDGSEPGVRQRFAQLAYDRAALAERTYRRAERDDQVHRMLAYDDDGRQRARWTAPATLEIATPGAAATARPLAADRDHRRYGAPIALGATPVSAALPPGSYLVTLRATDRADVQLPVELGRGERLAIDPGLPRAIPAGFVYVPPGRFLYGSADDEDMRRTMLNAQPLHPVATAGYLIGRHEVTFGDWIGFLRATPPAARAQLLPHSAQSAAQYAGAFVALDEPSPGQFRLTFQPTSRTYVVDGDRPIHYADRTTGADQRWLALPVSGVSWQDARAYAAWLDHSGAVPGARPCDDHEWERAARGADDRLFPHGDRISPADADLAETYGRQPAAFGPDAVGSHPASDSPFGVSDLTGNDWELVASLHGDGEVAIRGGSWYHNALAARLNNREPVEPTLRTVVVGLRICASWPAR
ncbi:MAG TPA: SUMF1/EgtB/PvdO family nonheme iron enzyme [Kofleriaceae bacterium]